MSVGGRWSSRRHHHDVWLPRSRTDRRCVRKRDGSWPSRSSLPSTEFREAMERVYEAAFIEELDEWCADLGVGRPVAAYLILHEHIAGLAEFGLNAGCALPPRFDTFAAWDVVAFLGRVAGEGTQ